MSLIIENLECNIASTNILRSCSISINPREIVCLIGRNGAGKSSVLKTIIGLYPSRGGRIIFSDRDITTLSCRDRVKAGIAYAPEDSRMFPDLTVEENIRLGTWIREEIKREVSFDISKAIEIFPAIEKLRKRRAGTLSGGEKKMVSISRALALGPSLLLLDESFEGLSPLVVKAFSDAMKAIKKGLGASILLAESNLHNASTVGERGYVIDRGEIVFEGDLGTILSKEELVRLVGR